MKTKLLVTLAVCAASLYLTGCVVALGNREAKGNPTLGKQLTDLKQARESNAITEEEYQTAKKRLIEGK